jgi:hypothetical protein
MSYSLIYLPSLQRSAFGFTGMAGSARPLVVDPRPHITGTRTGFQLILTYQSPGPRCNISM